MLTKISVVIVHAYPLQLDTAYCRGLRWLQKELSRRGAAVEVLVPAEGAARAVSAGPEEIFCVGELRPSDHELSLVSMFARSRATLVLLPQGYPFCEIGTRACRTCPLSLRCESSQRVLSYRALLKRAARLVYQSPLHQLASESFMAEHTASCVLAPPAPWEIHDPCPAGAPAVAFPNPNDPGEWDNLIAYCISHPKELVEAHADTFPATALPPNLHAVYEPEPKPRGEVLQAGARLVALPERPVPFGQDAAAMILAGRSLVANENLGLVNWLGLDPTREQVRALVEEARRRLPEVILDAATRAPAVRSEPAGPRFDHILLWAHGLGLGDSINLLPLAGSLKECCRRELTWVLPARHLDLLAGSLDAHMLPHEGFDPEAARLKYDLIVEISVYRDRLYAGDIVAERWLQIELARPSHGFLRIHENLLNLLASTGLPARPERPRLRLRPEELEAGRLRLKAAGLDSRSGLVLAVHPGAGAAVKRWPAERFGELCRRVHRELQAGIVLVTGPGEQSLADAVLRLEPEVACDSRGEPLREVAALLHACTALVCNDSGLMHLACAVDTPVLALFGPSSEHVWGPSGPLARVVTVRSDGQRSNDLNALDANVVYRELIACLRQIATEPPTDGMRLLVRAPSARLEKCGEEQGWVADGGSARLASRGPDDPVARLLQDAGRPVPAETLRSRYGADLLDLALLAALLQPPWVERLPALEDVRP